MKRSLLVLTVLCAASALAMPTKDELAKAQSLVVELMADDVAAYKAKSKKAEEIGDTSVKYAQEASTEAAKFLLLKGAISYYVRGESYDKAADAVNALREAVPDVPPDVLEEIIRKNTARVTAKKAPRLYAIYQTVQVQVAAAKEVKVAQAALAKRPKDEEAIRKLAEAQALSGDWKAALGTFAQIGNKAGAMAKSETEGKDLAAVADFWWAYESYLGEDDADAFKAHAAAIYRQCLADGTIDGLKKNIVEKRIRNFVPVTLQGNDGTEHKLFDLPKKGRGHDVALEIASRCELNFVSCPQGTYMMGFKDENSGYKKHEVSIGRPFWIAKFPVTYAQWDAFMGKMSRRKGEKCEFALDILGGDQTPAALSYNQSLQFLDKLNKQFGKMLPQGYVFRLASEAECEYVIKSGKSDFDPELDAGKEIVSIKERCQAVQSKGFSVAEWQKWPWRVPYFAIGSRRANKWGVYDMLTSGWMYVLDSVKASAETDINALTPYYTDKSVDPLQIYDGPESWGVVRGCGWGYDARYKGRAWFKFLVKLGDEIHDDCFLRVVIGPDLVSEWKAKNGKK